MNGLGDEQALLAKARAARSLSAENDKISSPQHKSQHGISTVSTPAKQSWREAAKNVTISPRNGQAYPNIHEFERSVLPSIRTLRAQFVCGLCPHCERPLIESVLPQHIIECKQRNQQKLKEEESASTKQEKEAATVKLEKSESVEPSGLAGAKRKLRNNDDDSQSKNSGDGSNGNTAKRSKTTAKAKSSKTSKTPKPPKATRAGKPARQTKQPKEKPVVVYNPDKNCGVPLPNGQPCMRSLTCKQHSMGSKRAVQGRSAAYDVLLSNYHRQHQMKQAQLSATAAQAAQLESDQLQEAQAQQNPEREAHQVLEGVSRVFCPPLAVGRVTSSSSRSANFRLREMLAVALLPRRLPPTGDILYGRSMQFHHESPDRLTYVRSQAVQQALYLSQLQERQLQLRRQNEANARLHSSNGGAGSGQSPRFQPQNSAYHVQKPYGQPNPDRNTE